MITRVLIIGGLLEQPCAAQDVAEPEPTLIWHVRVFDGEDVHDRRSVLIENGLIKDADFRGELPADIRIVDGQGKTLIPRLIAAHIHIDERGGLEESLISGVTTAIDLCSVPQGNAAAIARTASGNNPMKLGSPNFLFSASRTSLLMKCHNQLLDCENIVTLFG